LSPGVYSNAPGSLCGGLLLFAISVVKVWSLRPSLPASPWYHRGEVTKTLEASGQLLVSTSVRRRAGIKAGDRLKFETGRGVITIRKSEVEDDEYSPEQRAAIMARLEKSLEDVRQGAFTDRLQRSLS
jgi:bifunctional DNA-binding transcriptional regulator/antitoxin component of YhaV-PrlF toxin-antitoxin module